MFDDKFVWGVASSAYQVEGTDPDDGRGKTVWDTFTEQDAFFKIRMRTQAVITCTIIKMTMH